MGVVRVRVVGVVTVVVSGSERYMIVMVVGIVMAAPRQRIVRLTLFVVVAVA